MASEKFPVAAASVTVMVFELPSSVCVTVIDPLRVPRLGFVAAVKFTVNWNALPPPPPVGLALIKEELLKVQWQLTPPEPPVFTMKELEPPPLPKGNLPSGTHSYGNTTKRKAFAAHSK